MQFLWRNLKFVPDPCLTAIKRLTTAQFRLRLREMLGGSVSLIPDKVITVSDGRKIHIGPDLIYWSIYQGLEFEPEATAAFHRLILPGDTVIDAGANYGWFATLFGQLVGGEGRVLAFEPVPTTYDRLREHIEINGLTNVVQAERSALGAESGETDIHVFQGLSHARASLSALSREDYVRIATPVQTIDEVVRSAALDRVDFIKCDVEGSELAVLRGARELLSTPESPIIAIELNDDTSIAMGYTTEQLQSQLRDYGYDHFYSLDAAERLKRVRTAKELNATSLLLASKGTQAEDRMAAGKAIKKAIAA